MAEWGPISLSSCSHDSWILCRLFVAAVSQALILIMWKSSKTTSCRDLCDLRETETKSYFLIHKIGGIKIQLSVST